jgi:hypothetical protein
MTLGPAWLRLPRPGVTGCKLLAPFIGAHRLIADIPGHVESPIDRLCGLAAAAIEDLARGVGLRTFRFSAPIAGWAKWHLLASR